MINFLFAEDAPEKMRITQDFFKIINEFDIFISDIVLLEIERAPDPKKEKFINIIKEYKMKALENSKETEELADI